MRAATKVDDQGQPPPQQWQADCGMSHGQHTATTPRRMREPQTGRPGTDGGAASMRPG